MYNPSLTYAKTTILAFFFCSAALAGGPDEKDAPPVVQVVDFSGLELASRTITHNFPTAEKTLVSISSEFGTIRVTKWANPAVRVVAELSVGAETSEIATEIAEAVAVDGKDLGKHIDIRTRYPETKNKGKVAMKVDYTLTVPATVDVTIKNVLGDTYVKDIGGDLVLSSLFGTVDIRNVTGHVDVRARGEFPFRAYNLNGGGTFLLTESIADFRRVGGNIEVTSRLGSVSLREIRPRALLDVNSNDGPIHLYVSDDKANIEATSLFGKIESDLPLERQERGDYLNASQKNPQSAGRISLETLFAGIFIHSEAPKTSAEAAPAPPKSVILEDGPEVHRSMTETKVLNIDAMIGDVLIEGVDEDHITLSALKVIRVSSKEQAADAFEALRLSFDEKDDTVTVKTHPTADMAAVGCDFYRIDLYVKCPRTTQLNIQSTRGRTSVKGTGALVSVKHSRGKIEIEHVKGELRLTNQNGDVEVADCAGPVDVTVSQGAVVVRNVYEAITISCERGKAVVDTPHGDVTVRNKQADLRILAISGIGGNYDLSAENANISIVLPKKPNVTIFATANNGSVQSAIPLTGTLDKNTRSFQGRLNGGKHRIAMETTKGDIVIN